jgi:hypothetical protein
MLLTRLWFLLLVSLVVAGFGVAMTLERRDLVWLAVAGSLLTCLGAVAACRKFIRLGISETLVSNIPIGGGAILPTQDDLDQARQADLDDRAAMLAAALILIGTPLQIFGYLLAGYAGS